MNEGLRVPVLPVETDLVPASPDLVGRRSTHHKKSPWKKVVLKFGSSVLTDPERYQDVALEIYRWYRDGYRTIAVVSAMGNTTDELLAETAYQHRWADEAITAHLLATGEGVSAARLALALDRFGIPARVLEPGSLGLITQGPVLDATCVRLNTPRILDALETSPVVVVPGFVGQDEAGNLTLLGRGGTDLSALFMAEALDADGCHLVKDVDGLYDLDPAVHPDRARKFERANFGDVLALDEGIVQHKAVQFAAGRNRSFQVRALHHSAGTEVSSLPSQYAKAGCKKPPLRLAVFGEGEMLACLLEMAKRFPDLFEVVFTASPASIGSGEAKLGALLAKSKPGILVDLGTTTQSSQAIVAAALAEGIGLLSTNAGFLAESAAGLAERFKARNLPFLAEAAAGGVLPMVETIRRLSGSGQVRLVEASLSWPAQFLLKRLLAGESLDEATAAAKELGIQPSALEGALDGQSSLHSFLLCLNLGLGLGLLPSQVEVLRLESFSDQIATLGSEEEWRWCYLARLDLDPSGIAVGIGVRRLDATHPLACLPPDGIGICIDLRNGQRIVLNGRDSHPRSRMLAVLGSLLNLDSP